MKLAVHLLLAVSIFLSLPATAAPRECAKVWYHGDAHQPLLERQDGGHIDSSGFNCKLGSKRDAKSKLEIHPDGRIFIDYRYSNGRRSESNRYWSEWEFQDCDGNRLGGKSVGPIKLRMTNAGQTSTTTWRRISDRVSPEVASRICRFKYAHRVEPYSYNPTGVTQQLLISCWFGRCSREPVGSQQPTDAAVDENESLLFVDCLCADSSPLQEAHISRIPNTSLWEADETEVTLVPVGICDFSQPCDGRTTLDSRKITITGWKSNTGAYYKFLVFGDVH